MSLSSNLKTLQSMASSLDYLQSMLSHKDISLENYFFVTDLLNKMAALHKLLESRNIVLEIEEDERGVPIGHRLYVENPQGNTVGVSVRWDPNARENGTMPDIPWRMVPGLLPLHEETHELTSNEAGLPT